MKATAKQRHRDEALGHYDRSLGGIRCILAGVPSHECGGRLQAHHAIPVQTLRRLYAQAVLLEQKSGERRLILGRPLSEWIEDGRNAFLLCEIGHRQVELGHFDPDPHYLLEAFAADAGLEHYLPQDRRAA